MNSIDSLYGTANLPTHTLQENAAVLVAIASGKGSLNIAEQTYELIEGSVVLIPAFQQGVLLADPRSPMHVLKLSIGICKPVSVGDEDVMIRRSDVASGHIQFFPHEPSIVAKMEALYRHRLPADELRYVKNQILFHQLILQLLERQETDHEAGEQPSLERSISYLENRFNEKITREHLAAMAGISPSHYSILFKKVTGFSPNEYLSRLRVHRAMELLIGGTATLRDIALKVGYKDEFYLSRRFKRQTGASPSYYDQGSAPRVAVMLAPYASHLLQLGLEPVVTIAESGEYVHAEDVTVPQSMIFVPAGSSVQHVQSVLLENNVGLIIAARQHLQRYGMNAEQLRAAAPVIDVSWMGLGWKDHFRLIAHAINRSEKAEQWLADFEQEEQRARQIVQQTDAAGEVIAIFVLRPQQLLVYGARNVGYVLYQSLGLNPPDKVRDEMERKKDLFHSFPIELEELADYAGDRLLVIVYPDANGSTTHAEAVFRSSEWQQLAAVRQNRTHHLNLDDWIPYNPVSIRLQLQRAVALLVGD
nr:AraC family transcriptional regulator [Paenibacillus roseus]